MERSTIQYGNTTIAYAIQRSGRRNTVALTVEPAGTLVVTAPDGVTTVKLDTLVHSKAQWVVTRLRAAQKLDAPRPKSFVSGETFLYLGRQYRLQVVRGGEPGSVALERGRLRVSVSAEAGGGKQAEQAEQVRAALVGWYVEHAKVKLEERVQWWCSKLEVAVPRVLIREQEKRWGSCSPGVVRLNWRIVQAPMGLVDYVVAHEVVHLLHDDHGKAFWSRLGGVMPGYERRRDQLRVAGVGWGW
jgi:predicted metal-dependent hydrolase